MKSLTSGLCIAFAASTLGGLGCGAAEPDETVAEVQEAIDISTWNGLVGMASTGTYVLKANIDAGGRTWTPKTFSGTFDGGNRTIRNLTITGGSFFSSLTNATVKNVKFINLTLNGSKFGEFGGIASNASNSAIENCAVEATINVSAIGVGGLLGSMRGGRIYRSYAKGTIDGNIQYSGGLVGIATKGTAQATITESYAQVVVNPLVSPNASNNVVAGGLVGSADAAIITDVYAVGNVTGRGGVGGIVGKVHCSALGSSHQLFKTIYRGDVRDSNRPSSSGGWAGPVGTVQACSVIVGMNYYDRSLDGSTNWDTTVDATGYTTTELRSPTSVIGGVYCGEDLAIPARCGDRTWYSPPWTAGTSSQHHSLMNLPGPNVQLP
jgi:hypothetical protein